MIKPRVNNLVTMAIAVITKYMGKILHRPKDSEAIPIDKIPPPTAGPTARTELAIICATPVTKPNEGAGEELFMSSMIDVKETVNSRARRASIKVIITVNAAFGKDESKPTRGNAASSMGRGKRAPRKLSNSPNLRVA